MPIDPEYPKVTGRDPIAAVIQSASTAAASAWQTTPGEQAAYVAHALRLAINEGRITEDDLNLLPAPCDLCGGDCFATDEDTIEDEAGVHHRVCLERYHAAAIRSVSLEVTSEQALAYDANDPKNPSYVDRLLDQADNR